MTQSIVFGLICIACIVLIYWAVNNFDKVIGIIQRLVFIFKFISLMIAICISSLLMILCFPVWLLIGENPVFEWLDGLQKYGRKIFK